MSRRARVLGVLATLGLATLGGLVGLALRVPAGGIIGALVAVGGASIATGRVAPLPPWLRYNAQVLTGIVIGSGVGPHLVASLGQFWLPALAMTAWIIVVGLSLGWWLSRRTGLDLPTALLCFAPGGVGEMTLTAPDVGADARLVAMVGLMRVLLTIASVPLVLGYLVLRP